MAIEVNGKKYRYYPYDAFYVNGQQVKEAYFNGTKYYPEPSDDATFLAQTVIPNPDIVVPAADRTIEYYPDVTICVFYISNEDIDKYNPQDGRGFIETDSPPRFNMPKYLLLPACEVIGYNAFNNDYGSVYFDITLEEIDIPTCTLIEDDAFTNCKYLHTVNAPLCTFIGEHSFYGCDSLSTVNFESCEYVSLGAFEYCAFTEISLPACREVDSYAFSYCANLRRINMPIIEEINDYGLRECPSLESAYFPECTHVGEGVFEDCSSLEEVYLPACRISSLRNMFFNCPNLQKLTVKAGSDIYGNYVPSTCEVIYV